MTGIVACLGMTSGLQANAQTLGFGSHADNVVGGQPGSGVAIGFMANGDSTSKGGSSPVAIGSKSNASGAGSQVAVGDHATATGMNSIAIGGHTYRDGATATGDYAITMGAESVASGTGALAFGGDASKGAVAAGNYAVAFGAQALASGTNALALGKGAQAGNDGDVALGAGSITQAAVGTSSVTINSATYGFAGTTPISTVSIGSAGSERTLTNVAAGRIDSTSTDAVNGSQLNAFNEAMARADAKVNALGSSVANAFGGGAAFDPSTGLIGAPAFTVYGQANADVASAIAALQSGAPVQYSTAAAPTTGLGPNGAPQSNDVTLVGPDATSPVALHNVAAGVAATDAVNVAQLNEVVNAAVINIGPTGDQWVASNPATVTAPSATGTDALAAGSSSVASGKASTAIGTGAVASADNSVALGANSVADQANTVSVGSAGNERRVTNVAAGTAGTDAVNVNQLNTGLGNLQNQMNANVANLQDQISSNLKKSYGGTAAAIAIAGLRYDDRPGKVSAAAAVGYYHSQMGLAAGVGGTSDDGRWRVNGGLTVTPTLSSPDVGAVVGVSHTFN
ncbi:YadA-like family protein [Caballeronia sp. BR00000012568055]|uniref:YadA family autotransporter adhesin n=1 Tax=Caballeronia sp. BR00000012568055 TaxID=2918761 RepID=UPI0023F69B16|nr:YadA-like family protein [Caballeronia sp. BR00000012568055]